MSKSNILTLLRLLLFFSFHLFIHNFYHERAIFKCNDNRKMSPAKRLKMKCTRQDVQGLNLFVFCVLSFNGIFICFCAVVVLVFAHYFCCCCCWRVATYIML